MTLGVLRQWMSRAARGDSSGRSAQWRHDPDRRAHFTASGLFSVKGTCQRQRLVESLAGLGQALDMAVAASGHGGGGRKPGRCGEGKSNRAEMYTSPTSPKPLAHTTPSAPIQLEALVRPPEASWARHGLQRRVRWKYRWSISAVEAGSQGTTTSSGRRSRCILLVSNIRQRVEALEIPWTGRWTASYHYAVALMIGEYWRGTLYTEMESASECECVSDHGGSTGLADGHCPAACAKPPGARLCRRGRTRPAKASPVAGR